MNTAHDTTNTHNIETWDGVIAWALAVAESLGFPTLQTTTGTYAGQQISIHLPEVHIGITAGVNVMTAGRGRPGKAYVTGTDTPEAAARYVMQRMARAHTETAARNV